MTKEIKSRTLRDRLISTGEYAAPIEAERLIRAGVVRVDGVVVDKPGALVRETAQVTVRARREYVGRGALKLEGALRGFGISVEGRVCADVGACTGGFTDVLLRAGAARVYAIDVGYGDLDWRLRNDPRVVVLERTNARYLEKLSEPVSFVCIDVSFISLIQILGPVCGWLAPDATVVALVKPQFEAAREDVGEGGIVRDPAVHQHVLENVLAALPPLRLRARGVAPAQIAGMGGNQEFLLWCDTAAATPQRQ